MRYKPLSWKYWKKFAIHNSVTYTTYTTIVLISCIEEHKHTIFLWIRSLAGIGSGGVLWGSWPTIEIKSTMLKKYKSSLKWAQNTFKWCLETPFLKSTEKHPQKYILPWFARRDPSLFKYLHPRLYGIMNFAWMHHFTRTCVLLNGNYTNSLIAISSRQQLNTAAIERPSYTSEGLPARVHIQR